MLIGFSTGALAYSNFREALKMLREEGVSVVELSALRFAEWEPLLASLNTIDLASYEYVSIHVPSSLTEEQEQLVVASLHGLEDQKGWPAILHPDAITDWSLWHSLGARVCVENMDMRKPIGRTEPELQFIFDRLPEAGLCFDIGHAWQIDPTMGEAYWILKHFRNRIRQVHVSEVNSRSKHDVLSYSTIQSFCEVAYLIPPTIPLILETPARQEQMRNEMNKVRFAFTPVRASNLVA